MSERDWEWMQWALRLARRAEGRTHPNPMVGCVLVGTAGEVVGTGYHHRAGAPHAEVEALRQAGTLARGGTAIVTLEPCCHYGRTPPCTEALIQAGVVRVVVAMSDPNPLVAGRGIARLREAGVTVTLGVGEVEATRLNRPFLTWVTCGRPLITLKAATSLDGKMATSAGESQWITGTEARAFGQRLRGGHEVVMTGIGTVLADNPRLTCRLPNGRDPVRLVVDSRLRTPPSSLVVTGSEAPLWLAVVGEGDAGSWERLRQARGERETRRLSCAATATGRVDLGDLFRQLGSLGVTAVLAECGCGLAVALWEGRWVDRVAWFLAPMVIGGDLAAGVWGGRGVDRLDGAPRLIDATWRRLGEDWLVEGEVVYAGVGG